MQFSILIYIVIISLMYSMQVGALYNVNISLMFFMQVGALCNVIISLMFFMQVGTIFYSHRVMSLPTVVRDRVGVSLSRSLNWSSFETLSFFSSYKLKKTPGMKLEQWTRPESLSKDFQVRPHCVLFLWSWQDMISLCGLYTHSLCVCAVNMTRYDFLMWARYTCTM